MTKKGEPLSYLLGVLQVMPGACSTWPYSRNTRGYAQIWLDGRCREVHQVVCEWYHGPRPEGLEACHSCDNGPEGCFTPSHLRWDTHANNMSDPQRRRSWARGERHGKARLTPVSVLAIRAAAKEGVLWKDLAATYGVHPGTVQGVVERRTWRWLNE